MNRFDKSPGGSVNSGGDRSCATAALSKAGVSIWLDDLSRDALVSGELRKLIDCYDVVGVTTNPTIFSSAVEGTDAYNEQLKKLAQSGASVPDAVDALVTADIIDTAKLLYPTFQQTGSVDGRVSVEVEPAIAFQAKETLERATHLWKTIDQPNLMVKIPATAEGIDAIAEATAAGISVNVTLLFNIDVYRLVIRAYLSGLERALLAGRNISDIFSVASFFVSRVDTEVDTRLGDLDTPDALELRGTVGVANARLAYRVFQEEFARGRAERLLARGANIQRPLWASTGVKNPELADTYYVNELIAPDTVITMPPGTLRAFADHGRLSSDTITDRYGDAVDTFERLKAVGVSYEKVTDKLLAEGVEKFESSWRKLNKTVAEALRSSR
ncbi:transaldolase [Leifsonia soli]|uniref:Transaldolase n=1 Tax=Leifsonia soli TaxID=582665 RepID=A0A852T6M1_9MICO|nr:transaldolase [Leifsonia soli]NYD76110.1 transaldolase [Leifsonia soli]